MTLQINAHMTLTLDYRAKTLRLSGTLTKRMDSVSSSGMEVVEAIQIGLTQRLSASNNAPIQVGLFVSLAQVVERLCMKIALDPTVGTS